MRFLSAFAIALLSSSNALVAAPVPPQKLVRAVNIPHSQFRLKNGLRVIVHTDRKAPVVAVSLWYDVGSKHEPKGKTGFAHLFEHLMFGGSENVPQFDEAVIGLGGSNNNGSTWYDRTNYYVTVPKSALQRMLYIESDRMGWLLGAVTQQGLDAQRGVVQNEKRQRDNQPFGLVDYAQAEALLPEGHPYRHATIGSMADLDNASMDDVRGWFRQHYGPNNAVLVLAGDIDAKSARPLVENAFGAIAPGPQQKPVAVDIPSLPAPKKDVMQDRVANVRLYRSWVVPGLGHPDAVPLSVGAAVLGGLASSRLDNALVRDEKLAVAVTASQMSFAQLGFFEATVDVLPGVDPTLAEKRLDALIAELIAKGPSEDEVRRVITRSVAGELSGMEDASGKASTLAQGALYRGDPDWYRKELKMLARTKAAQVQAALARWITRPAHTLKVVPGERAPYEEAKGNGAPAPEAAPIARMPRAPMPGLSGEDALSFPAIERTSLSNGIKVHFARRATVPQVQVRVIFDAGYAADPKTALGTQSMMLTLMNEGTKSRTSLQIAEESERLGASITTGAGLDRTSASLTALTANLGASLDLLADVVRNPAFAPAEVDRIRDQQLARIASEFNSPNGLAGRTMPAILWGKDHPYGIPASGTGDPEVVKRLTAADLQAFHQSWLRPETAQIFVAGDTSLTELKPLLERSFGSWKVEGAPPARKAFDAAVPAPSPRIILVDRPGSPQSLIQAGVVLDAKGSDDLVTLRAANEVFGDGFLSRINQDLRETKGWSYGVRSGVGSAEQRVSFSIAAPVQADRTGDSIRALREQLTDFLGPQGVTAAELERTVTSNTRELPGSFETTGAVLSAMVSNVTLGRPDDYYPALAKKYGAMRAAALDATARAKIDPQKLIWVVVGDAKKVRAQLDGLGLPVEERTAPGAPMARDSGEK